MSLPRASLAGRFVQCNIWLASGSMILPWGAKLWASSTQSQSRAAGMAEQGLSNALIDGYPDQDKGKEVLRSLASLKRGEA
jgi:hypothetical protein